MSSQKGLSLGLGALVCAVALSWGCDGPGAPGAPGGRDGSVDSGPRVCARAAEGCICEPGTGPVDCYVESELGVCHAGQMYCQAGVWSACEWSRSYGEVGRASAALITDFSACSTCNPGCARATDEPEETDLTPSNSDNVEWSDEGGVTLDTRVPPYLPSCAELAAGLPPGGTYEQYCDEAGTLFFYVDDGAGGTDAVCAGDLAAQTFQKALCTCEDLDGAFSLSTDSFDSRLGPYTNASAGDDGNVGLNARHLFGGSVDIRGGLVVYGTSQSYPTNRNDISRTLEVNGPLRTGGQLTVGSLAGHAYVNGSTDFNRRVTIEGGSGQLHLPASATWGYTTGMGQQNYTVVREPVVVDEPCQCAPADQVDIAGFVAGTMTRNDNWVIGLDPDVLNGYSSGTHLSLPCGRFYLNDVNGGGNLRITATARTALFIGGDLAAGGSLEIDLANADAEVDVFVAGDISVGASLKLGSKATPSKVRLYVGGSNDIVFNAGSEIGGNFYAPNAVVTTSGEMSVFGALYARDIAAGSNANFHYDVAVLDPSCPPVEGRYWRDYDASTYCGFDSESRPDWGDFNWDADIPDGTDIRFEVQTADTVAGLDTATVVAFEVPPSGAPVNIGDLLVAGGEVNHRAFLRITARLRTDGVDSPLLRSMTLDIDCGFGTSGASSPGDFSCSGTDPVVCTQMCPAEVCDDGLDNDCDGLLDCGDDSCGTSDLCCTGEICGDGVSNDCDDLVDYWDLGECSCTAELCADGLDNDSDGLIDCADTTECPDGSGCNVWGSMCSATMCVCPTGATEADCTDTVDNDCDGDTDCDDTDCGGTAACPTTESCSDGVDNDLDGLVDCADSADCATGASCGPSGLTCDATLACTCPGPATEATCTDGADNDCDGAIDCGDSDCAGVSCDAMGRVCDATFRTCRCPTGIVESSCIDGADNDCDGLIDCNDGDCDGVGCGGAGLTCDFATTSCVCPGGATETTCGDGFDNDCDFTADCMDSDCNGMSCNLSGGVCDFATGVCL